MKTISRAAVLQAFLLVLFGWVLDLLTSFVGVGIRKAVPGGEWIGVELSPYFFLFPSAWLLMMAALALFVYKFKRAPFRIRASVLLWMIVFSYLPALRNTALILGMI